MKKLIVVAAVIASLSACGAASDPAPAVEKKVAAPKVEKKAAPKVDDAEFCRVFGLAAVTTYNQLKTGEVFNDLAIGVGMANGLVEHLKETDYNLSSGLKSRTDKVKKSAPAAYRVSQAGDVAAFLQIGPGAVNDLTAVLNFCSSTSV